MISKLTLVPGNYFFPCSCDPNKYPHKTSCQETEPKQQKVMTQVPQQIFYRGLKDKLQDFRGRGGNEFNYFFSRCFVVLHPARSTIFNTWLLHHFRKFTFSSPFPLPCL